MASVDIIQMCRPQERGIVPRIRSAPGERGSTVPPPVPPCVPCGLRALRSDAVRCCHAAGLSSLGVGGPPPSDSRQEEPEPPEPLRLISPRANGGGGSVCEAEAFNRALNERME